MWLIVLLRFTLDGNYSRAGSSQGGVFIHLHTLFGAQTKDLASIHRHKKQSDSGNKRSNHFTGLKAIA